MYLDCLLVNQNNTCDLCLHFCMPSEVRIGLDRTAYTVDEDRNTVEVCARIIDGSLERSVEVDLFTSDMTAESQL